MDISARLSIAVTDNSIEALFVDGLPYNPTIKDAWCFNINESADIESASRTISRSLKEAAVTIVSFHLPSVIHERLYVYEKKENIKANIYRDLKNDFGIELKENWIAYESTICRDNICVYAGHCPVTRGNFYHRVLSSNKIKINTFETFTISLKRNIRYLYPGENVVACFTYQDYAKVLYVRNRRILIAKDIDFSWGKVVEEMSKVLGMSIADTTSFLELHGFEKVEGVSDDVYITLAKTIDPLVNGIQSVLDYIRSAGDVFGEANRIVFAGDIARLRYVGVYVERLIGVRVGDMSPIDIVDIGGSLTVDMLRTVKYLDILIGGALRRIR